jgi:acetate kinase
MEASAETLLACNVGSSSLKLTLFARDESGRWREQLTHGFDTCPEKLPLLLTDWLAQRQPPSILLHRIVHAGSVTEQAVPITADVIEKIRHWQPLAPLHNSLALSAIEHVSEHLPGVKQYAIFDGGAFAQLPAYAADYAVPRELSMRWPVRRYGFHGLAHRSQWRQVKQFQQNVGKSAERIITIQLGSGCSLAAWRDGTAIDTSMGFTPLEGLVMARRSGNLDPGILLHLLMHENWTPAALSELLHKKSGLFALAGREGDMRLIMAAAVESGQASEADKAVTYYCYQIKKILGSYIAALGGVDAISFGGGVAEHQPEIRRRVICGLDRLGIALDEQTNAGAVSATPLQAGSSATAVYLTPVNETGEMLRQYECSELMQQIAQETAHE